MTARFFGAKEFDRLKKSVAHALTWTLGIATAIAPHRPQPCLFIDPLLRALNTPDNIFKQAKTYIVIILCRNDNINVL